jgi:trehalose-6-phosphate synthase
MINNKDVEKMNKVLKYNNFRIIVKKVKIGIDLEELKELSVLKKQKIVQKGLKILKEEKKLKVIVFFVLEEKY